jgi:aminopeptidase N
MHPSISARAHICQVHGLAFACALALTAAATAAPQPKIRAEEYNIEISFEPEKGFLHAKALVKFQTDRLLDALELELNPKLRILAITDDQDRSLTFERGRLRGSPKFLVRLFELTAGEFALTFTYEGAPLEGRLGGLDYVNKDGILLRDEARWYPSVDLSTFTRNDFTIGVPSDWQAFTSGVLVASDSAGLDETYRWKTPQPVSSRSIVALPKGSQSCTRDSIESEVDSKSKPLSACYVGAQAVAGRQVATRALTALQYFGDALGTYSNSQLLIVEGFPGARSGVGYSAPGLMVASAEALKGADDPGYEPEFLPHEIAHQWFPIEVTLASQEEGWLAESLAEYLALRYLEKTNPPQARRMVARELRDALAPDPLRPLHLGLKLFALEPWPIAYATLYERGMLVFRTLESVIGRENVDKALRELYQSKASSSASIADFQGICEGVTGINLGWFFDYYIHGTRVPRIELRSKPSNGANRMAGTIVLHDAPADFTVRIEIEVKTRAGNELHSIRLHGAATPFRFATSRPAVRVILDPNRRLLMRSRNR